LGCWWGSMGVVHFLLLGGSPGAATVGLSYCIENYSRWKKERREILESIVVVTTEEVLKGYVKSPKPAIVNKYGTIQKVKDLSREPFDSLRRFVNEEFGDLIEQNRGKIDTCKVRIDDLEYSVLSIASKLLEYKEKEVWLNITGGMNPMTVQSLFTAYLGGIIAKIYYTYVPPEYVSLMKPPGENGSEKFNFIEVPMVKAEFDPAYFNILEIIKDEGGIIETENLLSKLKSSGRSIDKHGLLKMRGHGVIAEDKNGKYTILTDAGRTLLSLYENPIFKEYMQLVTNYGKV
ncbi:hypothetical protein KEJ51_07385, partial [Candidatus Bathyarchaeota archaeon]|nr:hypothetical protein [Candidatus Bathyarchaeota archaeon]